MLLELTIEQKIKVMELATKTTGAATSFGATNSNIAETLEAYKQMIEAITAQ